MRKFIVIFVLFILALLAGSVYLILNAPQNTLYPAMQAASTPTTMPLLLAEYRLRVPAAHTVPLPPVCAACMWDMWDMWDNVGGGGR